MFYKNSVKVLFSNFHLVWKSLLYHIAVFVFACLLIYLSVNPIYAFLKSSGFIASVVEVYVDFLTSLNLAELFESFNYLMATLYHLIVDNIGLLLKHFIMLAITVFFVLPYLSNFVSMANSNSLHYYMGSMNKQGFFVSFFDVLKKNALTQLVYFFITLPINIIIIAFLLLSVRLFSISFAWSLFAVFIIILGYVLLTALKNTIFVSWIPTMVVMNYGILKSLKISFKNNFRKFARIYGGMVGFVLTVFFINVFVGTFTFMLGLIITIPASYVLFSSFGMVAVYEAQGMRYYVDIYNVITPRKKEISDKISDMKYIV